MSNETRARVTQSIIDTYYMSGAQGLKVGDIAKQCGLTRQALHRYYPDLLEYIKGIRPIEELLPAADSPLVERTLKASHDRVVILEQELTDIKSNKEREIKQHVSAHITSLMNADILEFKGDETRDTIEKLTSLTQDYRNQITELKQRLQSHTISEAKKELPETRRLKTVLRPSLNAAMSVYQRSRSYDDYSAAKNKEMNRLIDKAASLITTQTHVIIYIEKFLADFEQVLERLHTKRSSAIVLALPVFTNAELRLLMKKLAKSTYTSVYVPEITSIAGASAQRAFRSQSVPTEEISLAERCETFRLAQGINELVYLRIEHGS